MRVLADSDGRVGIYPLEPICRGESGLAEVHNVSQIRSHNTTRRHLAEMESMGDLAVAETNNTSPLWPKVYFVTRRGLTRLKLALQEKGQQWTESLKDRRRSEGQSAQHALHELFITEFLLIIGCKDARSSQYRIHQILELLSRLSAVIRNRFWITTVQKINATIDAANILDRTFWRHCR
jgi:hypothetical protein